MSDKLANLAVSLELQNEKFIRGLEAATRSLDKLDRNTAKTARGVSKLEAGFNKLKTAAVAVGAAVAAFKGFESIVSASEKMDKLVGSFEALTGSTERAQGLLASTFKVVESTGVSLDAASEAVQRLTIGLVDLGATNGQIQTITETFIKLGLVGGARMDDVNGALIQFTQALASGRLQGDEFRSISERLPLVMTTLAKELNVTKGELKEMGSQGKLTADILANTLLNAAEETNRQFEKLPVTMEQAASRAGASFTKLQASLSKSLRFDDLGKTFFSYVDSALDALTGAVQWIGEKLHELNVMFLEFQLSIAEGWNKIVPFEKLKVSTEALKDAVAEAGIELTKFRADIQTLNNEGITIDVGGGQISSAATDLANLKAQAEKIKSADPFAKFNADITLLNDLLDAQLITWDEYARAVEKAQDSLDRLASAETVKELSEMEKNMQRLAVDGVGTLIDNIGKAKTSFSDMAAQFLRDIAKMIAKQQVMNALKSSGGFGGLFGFAHGGAFKGSTGLPHGVYPPIPGGWAFPMPGGGVHNFANGGVFGGVGRLSEAGRAEAIVPLQRTSGGDLGVKSSPVEIVVNNNAGVDVGVSESEGPDGSRMIDIMIERKVKATLANGSMDRVLASNYGVKRRPG